MEINFRKKYLLELYEDGKTTKKKYNFPEYIIKAYQLRIEILRRTQQIEELFTLNSLEYKKLGGDKEGISSIRINDGYRIEFIVKQDDSEEGITVCDILKLSNHYE